jgi:hypothetical protein
MNLYILCYNAVRQEVKRKKDICMQKQVAFFSSTAAATLWVEAK